MIFNSFEFILFLIPVLIIYYVTPSKFKWIILTVSSIIFYLSWEKAYALLLLFSIMFDYGICFFMNRKSTSRYKKLLLSISVIFNIGLLFLFKYLNFFAGFFSNGSHRITIDLIIPIGISFYTFMKLGYVIDVYKKKIEFEKHIGIFALYCMFFPLIISGPIERSTNMFKQYKTEHKFKLDVVFQGIEIFVWGVFKKLVIADRCAIIVNTVFDNVHKYNSMQLFFATILFSIQIYCDFSGYSDMARGIAKMFDIEVMDNFKRPYFSKSIGEFWRRWHISLSSWFRDYLYIPLGGSRVTKWRYYSNLVIVFIVSGLWHGANMTFIIWGGLHGFYLVWGNITKKSSVKIFNYIGITIGGRLYNIISILKTYVLVLIAWVFFRANSVSDGFYIIRHMFEWVINIFSIDNTVKWSIISCGLSEREIWIIAIAVIFMFIVHMIQRKEAVRLVMARKPLVIRWVVYYVLIFSIMLFGVYSYAEKTQFIYGKF